MHVSGSLRILQLLHGRFWTYLLHCTCRFCVLDSKTKVSSQYASFLIGRAHKHHILQSTLIGHWKVESNSSSVDWTMQRRQGNGGGVRERVKQETRPSSWVSHAWFMMIGSKRDENSNSFGKSLVRFWVFARRPCGEGPAFAGSLCPGAPFHWVILPRRLLHQALQRLYIIDLPPYVFQPQKFKCSQMKIPWKKIEKKRKNSTEGNPSTFCPEPKQWCIESPRLRCKMTLLKHARKPARFESFM